MNLYFHTKSLLRELRWRSINRIQQGDMFSCIILIRRHGWIKGLLTDKALSIRFFLSKQELYFVRENYEIFSTEVSAREKQGQTVVSHIKKLLGLLEFHPPFGHFEFVRWLGST